MTIGGGEGTGGMCASWQAMGVPLVEGSAEGPVLFTDLALSFWGGVDPQTGVVIDRHHPLCGQCITGRILAIPSGRGSCTGSSVLMELILSGKAPAGMVFAGREDILSLGAIVAEEMFGRSIPMVEIGPSSFASLRDVGYVRIEGGRVTERGGPEATAHRALSPSSAMRPSRPLELTDDDRALLSGGSSKAAQAAMRIVVRMAELLGAERLIDITRAHIDGCIYTGPASLGFAKQLCAWGARVKVPTTLNAITVDQHHWQAQGVEPALGHPASELADAYVRMGAQPTFTCAPYQLTSAPMKGEQIAWAESNAVVYANSVLGARTMKYPDYLDICIALTGRAPLAGCHVDRERKAALRIDVPGIEAFDDAFYPLLGYHVGEIASSIIPVIVGLDRAAPTADDLKAFGAAFGTTSGAPMFHMLGVTPEASTLLEATGESADIPTVHITVEDLAATWRKLNGAADRCVDLVSLGNPHFSFEEFSALASLCRGRKRHPRVPVIVTCGRATYDRIVEAGLERDLGSFGVQFVVDACWCMIVEPVIPPEAKTLMTNSGKYAHYGPGLSGRQVHFGSLADCVEAACTGRARGELPAWLRHQDSTRSIAKLSTPAATGIRE